MKKYLPLIIALLLTLPAPASEPWVGLCVSVADGDTITVLRDREQVRIRLYGIDAPEGGQDFGTVSRRYVGDLCHRQTVTVTPVDTDRYGRTVALVEVDGVSVNRELIAAGLAWVYPQYCKIPECAQWRALEADARAAKRGLWAHPDPVPPWEWRRRGRGAAQQDAQSAAEYRGNTRSGVFHKPECRDFDCANCTAVFPDRSAAVDAGFRPCGTCRP